MHSQTRALIVVGLLWLFAHESLANTPTFEASTCPFEMPEGTTGLRCGYLQVAEDRSEPDGRTLKLAVAIMESLAETPKPDPLVYLTGGPGGGSLRYVPARLNSPFWSRYREDRDLIFFDQRGTGFSDPAFCRELDVAMHESAFKGLTLEAQLQEELAAVEACRDKMLETGIDFAQYSSAASAHDLADLRIALGIDEWNVFGLSYGTRLALVTLREAPEGIRSVILDSLYPPNSPVATRRTNFARALRLAFDRCASDITCQAAFPHLEQDFHAMLKDYEANPIEIVMDKVDRFVDGRIVIDGSLIASGMYQGFYDGNFVEMFPLLVRETGARNRDVLSALANGLVRDPHAMSRGLNLSIQCREADGRATQALLERDRSAHPGLDVWRGPRNSLALCDAWHQERADAAFAEPVHSDVPTLLVAGGVDPISPPSFADLAKETLSNGTLVLVPGAGHSVVPTTECTRGLVADFLGSPTAPLNTDCINDLPQPRFITKIHMNPGISRLMISTTGSNIPVPAIAGAGALILSASVLVAWPAAALWRRARSQPVDHPAAARRARWFAALAALLAVGFLGALAAAAAGALSDNPYLLAFGLPANKGWVFLLPWLAILAALGTILLAIKAWRSGWWGTAARVHYSLAALGGLGFSVWLVYFGFI